MAGLFCYINFCVFHGSVAVNENVVCEYCITYKVSLIRICKPLNFYSWNTPMPAILKNIHPWNKSAIRYLYLYTILTCYYSNFSDWNCCPHTVDVEITAAPDDQILVLEVDDTDTDNLKFTLVNVTFSCVARGISRPSITWRTNANYTDVFEVEEFPEDKTIQSNLTLTGILPSIDVIGVSCIAVNQAGEVVATSTLITLRKYVIL